MRERSERAATTAASRPAAQQGRRTADVVGMVVGLEHRHQLQLPLLEPVLHRRGQGRIHHGRLETVVEHEGVVGVQHRDQLHPLSGGRTGPGSAERRWLGASLKSRSAV